MASRDSRVSSKIRLVERRKLRDGLPSQPVVGDRFIAVSYDHKTIVGLDRAALSVAWRSNLRGYGPVEWLNETELLIGADRASAVLDATEQRVQWRAKTDVSLGGETWRDHVLTWPSEQEIEVRDQDSGGVVRSIKVPEPAVKFATRCGDRLLCETRNTGDPIRALDLNDGSVAWRRDLLAEMKSAHGVDRPGSAAVSFVPGSRCFVAVRGSATLGCSLEDGRILWKAAVNVPYYWPLVENGAVYALDWKRFVVIDEATGALRCDRSYPQLQGMYHVKRGSLIGGLVVFVSESGHVAGFDVTSGDLAFLEHHPKVEFWGSAVADGRLLVSGSDGNLWVFEDLDGASM